jgi:hypothetical protein
MNCLNCFKKIRKRHQENSIYEYLSIDNDDIDNDPLPITNNDPNNPPKEDNNPKESSIYNDEYINKLY